MIVIQNLKTVGRFLALRKKKWLNSRIDVDNMQI